MTFSFWLGEITPLQACTSSAGICSIHENIEKYGNVLNPGVMYTSFGSENNGRKGGKEYRFLQVIKHFQNLFSP